MKGNKKLILLYEKRKKEKSFHRFMFKGGKKFLFLKKNKNDTENLFNIFIQHEVEGKKNGNESWNIAKQKKEKRKKFFFCDKNENHPKNEGESELI